MLWYGVGVEPVELPEQGTGVFPVSQFRGGRATDGMQPLGKADIQVLNGEGFDQVLPFQTEEALRDYRSDILLQSMSRLSYWLVSCHTHMSN